MFVTRLASGIVLLAAAIFAMGFGGLPLLLILYLCAMIAYRELMRAMKPSAESGKCDLPEAVGFLGVTAFYGALYFCGRDPAADKTPLLMCIVGVFMVQMFVYVVTFPRYNANQVAVAVFSFLYAPVMLSFVYLTRVCPQGIYLVWLILISSWGCDTCAYAVGKLIGKKKIFPLLSPKKSLEGCIGGILGAALIGGLYGYFAVERAFPDRRIAPALSFICAMGALMSMVGDLAASAIKRNHDIKDYGRLIPGHGGIMDRFDSMLVTAPMVYFLALLMIQS